MRRWQITIYCASCTVVPNLPSGVLCGICKYGESCRSSMAPTLQHELDHAALRNMHSLKYLDDAVGMSCMIYLNCPMGEKNDAIDNAGNTHQVPGTAKRYQYSGTLSKLSCIRQTRPLYRSHHAAGLQDLNDRCHFHRTGYTAALRELLPP